MATKKGAGGKQQNFNPTTGEYEEDSGMPDAPQDIAQDFFQKTYSTASAGDIVGGKQFEGHRSVKRKKPSGSRRLSKSQKAIAWADANRDAASKVSKGFATTYENYVGYEADENYATKLTWNARIPNGHKGIKKGRKK